MMYIFKQNKASEIRLSNSWTCFALSLFVFCLFSPLSECKRVAGHKQEKSSLQNGLRPVYSVRSLLDLNIEVSEKSHVLEPFEDSQTKLMGYKDKAGKVVIKAQFKMAHPFNKFGIADVWMGSNDWRKINTEGQILVRSYFFDNGPDYFCSGLARFTEKGKIGFIDQSGKTIIPAQFDWARPFSCTEPITVVCIGCHEEQCGSGVAAGCCHSEMKGGSWGAIDKQGMVIVPLEFDAFTVEEKGIITFKKGKQAYELYASKKAGYQLVPVNLVAMNR